MSALTATRLREVLVYDSSAGQFRWLQSRGPILAGAIAGTKRANGYTQIRVDGRFYRAHRLAWLYIHGVWPSHDVDHINGDRDDNRIDNLRDVTRAENMQNERRARRNSKTGLLGASPNTCGGYRADIKVNGRQTLIGVYPSAEQAHQAYLQAKRAMHPMGTL